MKRTYVEILYDRFNEVCVEAQNMSVYSWLMVLSPLVVVGVIWYLGHRKIKL